MRFHFEASWGGIDIWGGHPIGYRKVGVTGNVLNNTSFSRKQRMKAKYKAIEIANYFIWKASQEQELISNMKLQKLIYYAQGIAIAMGDIPLFNDEIRAWSYGPVVPSVYQAYKENGASGIPPAPSFSPDSIDGETRIFLDNIHAVFGQFSAARLMQLSHSDQCWIDARPRNGIISHGAMRDHLKKYLDNGKKA